MTDTLRLRIIELLIKDFDKLYSISEISKKLGVAYSHCNTFVKDLVSENVINIQKIANAHICIINFNEPLTYSYISMFEYRKLVEWKKKIKSRNELVTNIYNSQKNEKLFFNVIFENKSVVYFVIEDKFKKKANELLKSILGKIKFKIIDDTNFEKKRKEVLEKYIIIQGAEKFWYVHDEKITI